MSTYVQRLFATEVDQNLPDDKGGILPIVLMLTRCLLRHYIAQRLAVRSVNKSDGNDTLEEKEGK